MLLHDKRYHVTIFMFCLTSCFSNQIQIDQFEFDLKGNSYGRTWTYEYTPPQLTFQLMSNHRRVLHLQMLQTFISDYSCLVSLFLHCPTLLGVLTITRIPISNHKFATLLDYGGVLHLQMLQTFPLIQH